LPLNNKPQGIEVLGGMLIARSVLFKLTETIIVVLTQLTMSTPGPCVYLVEEKAARERRWPPPSYAGPRNVRVLTLHDPTTVTLWETFLLLANAYTDISVEL